MSELVSHVSSANTNRSANIGMMLALLNQQLSWQALPVPPPSANVDQLSGMGKTTLTHCLCQPMSGPQTAMLA